MWQSGEEFGRGHFWVEAVDVDSSACSFVLVFTDDECDGVSLRSVLLQLQCRFLYDITAPARARLLFLCVNGVYSSIRSSIPYHDTTTILSIVEMYIGVLGDWFKAMPNRQGFRPVVCSCDLMGVDYTGATAFEVCTYQVLV